MKLHTQDSAGAYEDNAAMFWDGADGRWDVSDASREDADNGDARIKARGQIEDKKSPLVSRRW